MKQSMEVWGRWRTTNIFEEPLAKGSYFLSWIFSYLHKIFSLVHLLRVVLSSILIWRFYLCRVDGLRNCLEVPLPSRTAQVGTFSCIFVFWNSVGCASTWMFYILCYKQGGGWTHPIGHHKQGRNHVYGWGLRPLKILKGPKVYVFMSILVTKFIFYPLIFFFKKKRLSPALVKF